MEEQLKHYKKLRNFFWLLSFLATVLPLFIYVVIGFKNGSIKQAYTLGVCLTTCIIFTAINLIFRHHIKCTIYILLIGLYISVGNLIPLFITMGICTALEEFIFTPIYNKCNKEIGKCENTIMTIKEIDKRGRVENKA